ncbi:biotin--[acetyl-CoA-carboxylase] ligase [Pontiella sp.]|uniref:biotin--[acetyl-CoA-carboxylase] ligase n=1 Tax=Pontiella sp. TaxID=2837462 RepID=UPI0035643615
MEFNIEWHDRLGSTNACLKERLLQGFEIPSGLIIAAREQTAGRGRSDRRWLSAPDTNLCCSIYIGTAAELRAVPSLTMAVALAVAELLNALDIAAAPKWPNDVLVGEKKICGILSERVEHRGNAGIVVGIGLNVNMTSEEAAAIDRPATSMLIEGGQAHEPASVLEALFPRLDHWIGAWQSGGFSALRKTWTQKAGPIGKPLCVHDGSIKKSGTLAGFGDHGELLLQTECGLETIWSGDVS